MRVNYIDNMDCLEGLREVPDKSVDLIVTDPPYMFSQASAAGRKIDPWADWCNAALWYATWFREARRVPGGAPGSKRYRRNVDISKLEVNGNFSKSGLFNKLAY